MADRAPGEDGSTIVLENRFRFIGITDRHCASTDSPGEEIFLFPSA
jgi:hypothetical protein